MIAALDSEWLKRSVDLAAMAGRYTRLGRWSAHEVAGPCPRCGGKDRFHVHGASWFKCYRCHPRHGDAIEFVMWLHGYGFRMACEALQSSAAWSPGRVSRNDRTAATTGADSDHRWREEKWQRGAKHEVDRACLALENAEGAMGRDYLGARGILPETWRAWRIGFGLEWHPALGGRRPAIVMPWQGRGIVKAVQYRFVGEEIGKRERFGARAGGERTVFGVDLLRRAEVLILVEGELNALSLWQVLREGELAPVDVVSAGSEANFDNEVALMLAERYGRVIVWADSPGPARQFAAALDRREHLRGHSGAVGGPVQRHVQALESPDGLDANDLLRQDMLGGWVAHIMRQTASVTSAGRERSGCRAARLAGADV